MILPHLPPHRCTMPPCHALPCSVPHNLILPCLAPVSPAPSCSGRVPQYHSTTVPQCHRAQCSGTVPRCCSGRQVRVDCATGTQRNSRRGFYPRQKMTWRIFSLLRIKGFLRGRKRIGGSCNKKGFSLGPTLLLGTDEADSDISLHPITIHH